MSQLVSTPHIIVDYARAVFLTKPHVSPLSPGETRTYPIMYNRGKPAAEAFGAIKWYPTVKDKDARLNRLEDTARLPSAEFLPATPVGNDSLQSGTVILTAPAANLMPYTAPVALLEMVQEGIGEILPHIYLLDDQIELSTTTFREYRFRYWIGDPPAVGFKLAWYETQLDAELLSNKITEVDRLPLAVFLPATPNKSLGAEVRQDGVLRLYPSKHENPITSAVGLLCLEVFGQEGIPCKDDVGSPEIKQRCTHYALWEDR